MLSGADRTSAVGAGTVIETLRACKPLVVVVNESLMDNHQEELADQLSLDGYLLSCRPSQLVETLAQLPGKERKRFPSADASLFPKLLDRLLFHEILQ